jgi:hypothetical protein
MTDAERNSGHNPGPLEDSAKIAAYDIVMGILRDQMALEKHLVKKKSSSQIDARRADAFRNIVDNIVYPLALSQVRQDAERELSDMAQAAKKKRAQKSPAKKRQAPKKSSKRDA